MSKRTTCGAKTYTGHRCSRIAVEDGMCAQHYKMMHHHKTSHVSPRRFSVAKVLSVYKGCPEGMVKRKGYTRTSFVRSSGSPVRGSRVKATCIPDRGSKGRAWKLKYQTMGIGPLKKGELSMYGYHYDLPASKRHTAIRKASKTFGTLSVERKLNALAVYNSKRFPSRSKIYKADSNYAAEIYQRQKKSK